MKILGLRSPYDQVDGIVYLQKRGWRDEASARLLERKQEWGIGSDRVLTSFDFIDADEGRPLRFENASFSFAAGCHADRCRVDDV
jgi:hypothetical protein